MLFSGGWTATPLLRSETQESKATIFTAAGENTLSESWCATGSLGRTCGSIYISAVVKALEAEAKEEIAGGTEVTTKEFAGTITNQLVNVADLKFRIKPGLTSTANEPASLLFLTITS